MTDLSRGGRGPWDRAAAIAQKVALFFQRSQIVADRDRGDAELVRQGGDVGGAVALHEGGNLPPPMLRHGRPGRRRPAFCEIALPYVRFHITQITPRRKTVKYEGKNIFKNIVDAFESFR